MHPDSSSEEQYGKCKQGWRQALIKARKGRRRSRSAQVDGIAPARGGEPCQGSRAIVPGGRGNSRTVAISESSLEYSERTEACIETTRSRSSASSLEMSKAAKKRLEAEKKVDATVFEYDEIYDKMQEAKLKQKEAKEADAKERKVSIYTYHGTGLFEFPLPSSTDILKLVEAQIH